MREIDYDVIIIGGGMVGASQALALAPLGLRIGIVEAFVPKSDQQPSYDARSIALSFGSRVIFESMNVWDDLRDDVTPIKEIHISDRGHFGVTRLSAQQENVDALGYVVENRCMGQALTKALAKFSNVQWICPAKLTAVEFEDECAIASVELNGESRKLSARLIVAADGGNSDVRKQLALETVKREYGQTAIISTVTPAYPHRNTAYERFTDSGPLAVLPMSQQRCSLVLTVRDNEVEEWMSLDDEKFLQQLTQRFGYRLGAFVKTAKRVAYPLSLLKTKQQVRARLVIIGNAAHTLHPIAGQGFNLGLRDVAELADAIAMQHRNREDIGSIDMLEAYAKARESDHASTALITDSLARIFSNRFSPLVKARSYGLVATDLIAPVKHSIARRAMGFVGRLPRLGRGLPL